MTHHIHGIVLQVAVAPEDAVVDVVAAVRVQTLVTILTVTTATLQYLIATIGVEISVVHGMTTANVTNLKAVLLLLRVVAMSITGHVMLVLPRKSATQIYHVRLIKSLYLKKPARPQTHKLNLKMVPFYMVP